MQDPENGHERACSVIQGWWRKRNLQLLNRNKFLHRMISSPEEREAVLQRAVQAHQKQLEPTQSTPEASTNVCRDLNYRFAPSFASLDPEMQSVHVSAALAIQRRWAKIKSLQKNDNDDLESQSAHVSAARTIQRRWAKIKSLQSHDEIPKRPKDNDDDLSSSTSCGQELGNSSNGDSVDMALVMSKPPLGSEGVGGSPVDALRSTVRDSDHNRAEDSVSREDCDNSCDDASSDNEDDLLKTSDGAPNRDSSEYRPSSPDSSPDESQAVLSASPHEQIPNELQKSLSYSDNDSDSESDISLGYSSDGSNESSSPDKGQEVCPELPQKTEPISGENKAPIGGNFQSQLILWHSRSNQTQKVAVQAMSQ
jgi:hypothetical protein